MSRDSIDPILAGAAILGYCGVAVLLILGSAAVYDWIVGERSVIRRPPRRNGIARMQDAQNWRDQ